MFKDSIRHKCNRLFPRSTHLNPVPFSPSDVPLLPLSLHGGCLAAPACSDGAGPDQHRLYWIWELPSVPAGRRSMAMATARSGRRRGRGRCRRTSDSTTRITTGRLKLLLPHGTADARAPPPSVRHRSLRAPPPARRRGCALLRHRRRYLLAPSSRMASWMRAPPAPRRPTTPPPSTPRAGAPPPAAARPSAPSACASSRELEQLVVSVEPRVEL